MLKIISFLIVIAIVGAFVRMAFLKLNPNRTVQPKSDFKRQLDIILWIPPALIALSVAWVLVEAIIHALHR
jgi:hypothetical protein